MFWIISILIQLLTLALLIASFLFKKKRNARISWWFILVLTILLPVSAFCLGVQLAVF